MTEVETFLNLKSGDGDSSHYLTARETLKFLFVKILPIIYLESLFALGKTLKILIGYIECSPQFNLTLSIKIFIKTFRIKIL